MSNTTGWDSWGDESHKRIEGNDFQIFRRKHGEWTLYKRFAGLSVELATRPTLRECQILAHDTARLWAGESE